MRTLFRLSLALALATTSASAQSQTEDALRIYLVDVEGGEIRQVCVGGCAVHMGDGEITF